VVVVEEGPQECNYLGGERAIFLSMCTYVHAKLYELDEAFFLPKEK
jgi:hypothetical protein